MRCSFQPLEKVHLFPLIGCMQLKRQVWLCQCSLMAQHCRGCKCESPFRVKVFFLLSKVMCYQCSSTKKPVPGESCYCCSHYFCSQLFFKVWAMSCFLRITWSLSLPVPKECNPPFQYLEEKIFFPTTVRTLCEGGFGCFSGALKPS